MLNYPFRALYFLHFYIVPSRTMGVLRGGSRNGKKGGGAIRNNLPLLRMNMS